MQLSCLEAPKERAHKDASTLFQGFFLLHIGLKRKDLKINKIFQPGDFSIQETGPGERLSYSDGFSPGPVAGILKAFREKISKTCILTYIRAAFAVQQLLYLYTWQHPRDSRMTPHT